VHLQLPGGQPLVVKVPNTRLVDLPPVGATARVTWRRDDCKVLAAAAVAAPRAAVPPLHDASVSAVPSPALPLASGVTK
jgi:putative spermidine/putrescine transport system ATP-binding protein